jgi:hypothetical protein
MCYHDLFHIHYPTVIEKSIWRRPQAAGSNRDVQRLIGHERDRRKTVNKESSLLSVIMICFTEIIPLLVRSQTGDFHRLEEATGISKGLLGMGED